MSDVFKKRAKDFRCGSHVHVSPMNNLFTLAELKEIAFAIVTYEDHVCTILPLERRDHNFCKRNTQLSLVLQSHLKNGKSSQALKNVRAAIKRTRDAEELCELMQGETRHALWNFQNTTKGSGTIEFRGGCCLRGLVRTCRWITFVVAFISFALEQVSWMNMPSKYFSSPMSV
jgi:hypothetical protein